MAKKKRKRVDYDSPLTSIYSPEYQYLMKQNAPENANVAGLGDWFSNLFNRNKQQPDFHRDTVSMGLGTENSLQGVGNGGIDWNNQDFSFTGQSNQQQFDYNPNSELNKAQQYQLSLKDPENLAPKQNGLNEQKKQNEQQPNTGSNINWGGIIGAAGTSAANAIQEGGSAADIAAGIMGIPVLAKMWKANTEWGDARIKEAQEKLTNPSIKFIQDANDTQGAGQGIKLNNQKNLDLIDTSGMLTTNNWKKFSSGRGSGTWWKNMATAQLQGAAAGSVGGPWGALGGATAGLLGSIGGLFGSKRRAKRAMNEYNRKITDIRTYANAENFRKIAERDLSNKNMLSNGLNQQNLQDMSNFKAYGGNLYYNNNNTDNYNNIAAMGGQFDMNLSPNMMNLWNDKQNIDKQKVNTQQMNFGLGNSFNQKLNTFDYGGSMNGMDLPTNMQSYENGGTHEQNPNGGIQVGVDQQGNPNLVEEGEFRWGDYVFSDRIEVDPDVLSVYNIASSKSNKKSKNKPSYADMAKKYADKNKELVNDPISKNSLNAYMDKLQKAQEDQKYQEQLQAQQDQQLADYRNALKSPAQSNPMYGSMKYNGLGNANQGLNTGTDEGMGNPMDSSDLSNVNRSGNAMMAAYGGMFANGGNLYPYGGYSRTPEDDAQLSFVRPLFNIDNYQNDWTNNNSGNLVRQGGVYDPYDLSVNPNPNLGLNPYEQRYTDKYVDEISKGDPRVRQQILQDDGLYDGKIDGIWGKKSKVAWDEFNKIRKGQYGTSMAKSSTPPVTTATSATSTQPVTTTTSTSPVAGNKTYSSTSKSFGYSGVNEEAKREYDDKNKYESSNGTENISVTNGTTPQIPVEERGILRNEQAGLAGYSPIDFNKYSEAGKYGLLAKGLAPNLMNWTGQTNWDYDPNWRPSNELEALGHGSYTSRTADHLGDYIAPNLMDLERLNNASQAQAAANARAIQNVANGRATGLASLVANDYNSQMGIGNNYATTEQYNADQKQKAAEFNRATNQFNAQANNDMYRDNLNAWMQGRQMDIQAMEAANRERQLERQYKDKVDRDAALNKQQDLAAMFDNQMNFLADEAKYNRDLNMLNSRRNNRFYYDKDNGWQFRGDNGYASDLNEYMTGRGVVLTSDDLNQIKQLDEDYGFGEESKAEKLAAAKSIIDRRKEVQDKEFADKATKEDEDLRFKAGKASEIHKALAGLQDDKGNNIYGNLAGNDIYGKYLDRDLYDEYKKGKISKQDLEYYIEAMKDVERQYNNYHFSKYNNKVNTDAYGGKLNNRKRGDYYYMNV